MGIWERYTAPQSDGALGENRSMFEISQGKEHWELAICCLRGVKDRPSGWEIQLLHATTERRDLPFWKPFPSSFKQKCSLEGCRHFLLCQALCFSICICHTLFLQCICFFKANLELFNSHTFLCCASLFVKEMNNTLQEKNLKKEF